WHRPRWPEAWFPDAFSGTMGGLLQALETGRSPDIPGRDNLKTIALCEAVLSAGREHRVIEMDGLPEGVTEPPLIPLSSCGRGVRCEGVYMSKNLDLARVLRHPSPPAPLPRGERGEKGSTSCGQRMGMFHLAPHLIL